MKNPTVHCLSVMVTDFVALNIFLPTSLLKTDLRLPEFRALPFILIIATVTSASSTDIL